MQQCDKCYKDLNSGDETAHLSKVYCEDCYIDLILEKSRKASYLECAHSFMLRLKPGFDNRRLFK